MSEPAKSSNRSYSHGKVVAQLFAFFAAFILGCFSVLAEDFPKIVSSPVSDFIGNPTISAVHRDSRGYLWIGTQQGLYQFDGSEVQYYSSSNSSLIRLPFSYITGIADHKRGGIIVSTYGGGLFRVDSSTRSISAYKADLLEDHKYVRSSFELPYGILLSSESGSAFVSSYSPKVIELGNSAVIGVGEYSAQRSGAPPLERVIFGTTQGIFSLDLRTGSYAKIFAINSGRTITSLASSNSNSIYFTSDDNTLSVFDQQEKIVERSIALPVSPSTHITEMKVFRDHVWIVTDEGLLGITKNLDRITTFNTDNSQLLNNHISILEVDDNQLWIGTYQGLNSLILSPFHTHSKDEGSTFEDVLAFAERENGDLYIGTYEGLYMYENSTDLHSKISFSEINSGNSIPIISLSAQSNRLLIGTWRRGLYALEFTNNSLSSAPLPKNSELAITSVTQYGGSSVWVSTFNNGIYLLNQELELRHHFLKSQSILALWVSPLGQVIAASKEHIYVYSPRHGEFKPVEIVFEGLDRFPLVLSIAETKDTRILLGTKDFGLFVLEPTSDIHDETKELTAHYVGPAAAGETFSVNAIEIDFSENIWVTTQKGILKYSSDLKKSTRFTKAHGLHGDDFNSGSSLKTVDGKLYFGGPRGYTSFQPDDIPLKRVSSKFSLTSITVTDDNGSSTLVPPSIERLELQHNHHSLTLTFAVHNFLDPWKSTYRHQMLNFDPQWTSSGRIGYATYNTLPPGEYRFLAEGYDSTGMAADSPISLELSVSASPYVSIWAIAAYTSLAIFLLAMMIYMRKIYVQREHALAEASRQKRAVSIVERDFIDLQENQDEVVQGAYQTNIELLSSLKSIYATNTHRSSNTFERSITALNNTIPHYRFQGSHMVVDVRMYVEELLSQEALKWFKKPESLITINNIPEILIAPKLALPIAIAAYELVHFFYSTAEEENCPVHYIEVNLLLDPSDDNRAELEFLHEGFTSLSKKHIGATKTTIESLNSFFERVGGELDIQFSNESNLRSAKFTIDHIPNK